jgi:sugar phosphate isomerase/epimerase
MIYISSSCVKHKKIKNTVQELVDNGFKNIELSGGTEYYNDFEDDLLKLQKEYNLNYLCHNYFPPPKEHFVLNLASLNDNIHRKSFEHVLKSIDLSSKLGSKKLGIHAGFFIDIKTNEIGKKITKDKLYDKKKSLTSIPSCFSFLTYSSLFMLSSKSMLTNQVILDLS